MFACATLGVLMVMESLSAFLHALRLHWVSPASASFFNGAQLIGTRACLDANDAHEGGLHLCLWCTRSGVNIGYPRIGCLSGCNGGTIAHVLSRVSYLLLTWTCVVCRWSSRINSITEMVYSSSRSPSCRQTLNYDLINVSTV